MKKSSIDARQLYRREEPPDFIRKQSGQLHSVDSHSSSFTVLPKPEKRKRRNRDRKAPALVISNITPSPSQRSLTKKPTKVTVRPRFKVFDKPILSV